VTPDAARALVAHLTAAFPTQRAAAATVRLYEDGLLDLEDEKVAAEVIANIVRTEMRWPPLALIRADYRRLAIWRGAERAETHGLPEPERVPIPDDVKAWLDGFGIGRPIDPPRRHTDEELAAAYALAKRQQAERERRRAELIEPTNEPPPASPDGAGSA
jgi:hypothetical protein